jgi:hypothetical protein
MKIDFFFLRNITFLIVSILLINLLVQNSTQLYFGKDNGITFRILSLGLISGIYLSLENLKITIKYLLLGMFLGIISYFICAVIMSFWGIIVNNDLDTPPIFDMLISGLIVIIIVQLFKRFKN